jgi:hypothetical protein
VPRKSTSTEQAPNPKEDQMKTPTKPPWNDDDMGDSPEDLWRLTKDGMTLFTRLLDKITPAET